MSRSYSSMVSKIVVATSAQSSFQDDERLFARIDLAWQNSSRNPLNVNAQLKETEGRVASTAFVAPRQPVKRKCSDATETRASGARQFGASPRVEIGEKTKKMRHENAARSGGGHRRRRVQARPVSVIDAITLSQEELGHTCEASGWTPPSSQTTFAAADDHFDHAAHMDQRGWDADDDFDDDLNDGFFDADECENLFLSLEKEQLMDDLQNRKNWAAPVVPAILATRRKPGVSPSSPTVSRSNSAPNSASKACSSQTRRQHTCLSSRPSNLCRQLMLEKLLSDNGVGAAQGSQMGPQKGQRRRPGARSGWSSLGGCDTRRPLPASQ